MRNRRRPGGAKRRETEPPIPGLEDELEEAADLLAHQEPSAAPPVASRPDPSLPTEDADPALIDPAD